ncbi:MAG: MBL fold metallo-hydrolase [Flavobacteriales bacterium]
MEIKQFEDKNLAHYSYAIYSEGEIALIDPARNPKPYYDFAKEKNAKIVAVIETHPHADFVSSHLEISQDMGAAIYVSKLLGAECPHQAFDEGQNITIGKIKLKALNTPGHSPDSISIVVENETGKDEAVFTGDTLFIGDCGRPDLRENAGNITAKRADLAKQMYHSLRDKMLPLNDEVLVYPAHGAGSLCGKGLSAANASTIGDEKKRNWSLQNMREEEFVVKLLSDQPFIPHYFTYDVAVNKKGAEGFSKAVNKVVRREPITCTSCAKALKNDVLVIDTRQHLQFKKSHLNGAINLMNDTKFETWLGSIVQPHEAYYLVAENEEILTELIERAAKIGYEQNIAMAFVSSYGNSKIEVFDSAKLSDQPDDYTIVDIRNESEVKTQKIFANSINIPLYELRERINEIPTQKPILIHCAGGYRSAAGTSIVKGLLEDKVKVFDLSEEVVKFK